MISTQSKVEFGALSELLKRQNHVHKTVVAYIFFHVHFDNDSSSLHVRWVERGSASWLGVWVNELAFEDTM